MASRNDSSLTEREKW
jgi:hypothetical protein